MKVALVRRTEIINDGEKLHRFVGVYFYKSISELKSLIDEDVEPSECDYLKLELSGGVGLLFSGGYVQSVEDDYLNYIAGDNEPNDVEPPLSLFSFLGLFAGQTEEMNAGLISALKNKGWQKIGK